MVSHMHKQAHAHPHSHSCGHGPAQGLKHRHTHHTSHTTSRQRLVVALGLGVLYMAVAFVGSRLADSLTLFADAGHLLMHNGALLIALVATTLAGRKPTERFPEGYGRLEALGSYTNGLLLLAVAGSIFYTAVHHFVGEEAGHAAHHHHNIDGSLMGLVAFVGLLLHGLSAWVLYRGRKESLNVHAVYLHIIYDVAATLVALGAGVVISLTHWHDVDVLAALFIALLMGRSAVNMLRRSGYFLLDGVPPSVHVPLVVAALKNVPHVLDVHQVVVRYGSRGLSLSAHLVMDSTCLTTNHYIACQRQAEQLLKEKFGIAYSVLQLEMAQTEA